MKTLLLALMFATSISFAAEPTPVDHATQSLLQADKLFTTNHPYEAARVDLGVLTTKGLPDNIYSLAFVMMGNIALTVGNLDAADLAYNRVLLLKAAPNQDKDAAKRGILLVSDLRHDAEAMRDRQPNFK